MSPPRPVADLVAGISVAFILIPQSLAYAELAGIPAHIGLYAASLPLIAAAVFASSPYLQTGPVALTALLSFGVLSPLAAPFSAEYVALAALLALLVGALRIVLGLVRAGGVAWLLSQPVLRGFVLGASLLILASQLPSATGVSSMQGDGVVIRAAWTLTHPGHWDSVALLMSLGTIALIHGGRRIHPLFPGVLVAVIGATVASAALGYAGPTVGAIDGGLALADLGALPWQRTPALLVGAAIIAVVGFAEPVSLARHFAELEGESWDPHREFVSQGVANVASGLVGGFPVGGSFSRTSVNHIAGARTRWSGAVTGVTVLVFLPVAWLIAPLPKAVLGGTIIAGVLSLLRPSALAAVWRARPIEGLLGLITLGATVWSTPHLERGVLLGVGLAVLIQLLTGRTLRARPQIDLALDAAPPRVLVAGRLWFFGAAPLSSAILDVVRERRPAVLEVGLAGVSSVDASAAIALHSVRAQAQLLGCRIEWEGGSEAVRAAIDRAGP